MEDISSCCFNKLLVDTCSYGFQLSFAKKWKNEVFYSISLIVIQVNFLMHCLVISFCLSYQGRNRNNRRWSCRNTNWQTSHWNGKKNQKNFRSNIVYLVHCHPPGIGKLPQICFLEPLTWFLFSKVFILSFILSLNAQQTPIAYCMVGISSYI